MQPFNLSTQKNSSSLEAKEGVEYIIYKDGKGNPTKLLNINHAMYAPFEGIVELEPSKIHKTANGNLRHLADTSFRQIRDRNTGFIVGLPISVDPTTDRIIYETINLKGKETLDLSIPDQRAKWICIKYSPFYTKSPNFQKSSRNAYKAIDREEEALQYEKIRRERRKAADVADTLIGEELEEMALMLGLDPKLMSPAMLYMEVNKFVENPNRIEGKKTGAELFMDMYNSETRIELGILKRGISTGVVDDTMGEGFKYRGVTLGFNEGEVIKFLRENPSVKTSIDLQSRLSQEGTQQSMTPAKKEAPIVDEKDAVIVSQKRRLEALEEQLRQSNQLAAEVTAELEIKSVDEELAELLKRGKQLDIKGIHMLGKNKSIEERKQLIKEKINEAEKQVKN